MQTTSWAGTRVTVMGLGTRAGGVGVARYLAEQGAQVTVTDLRAADDLAASIAQLQDLPIRFVLGRHDEADFTATGADMVVRNPGVPRRAPLLALARESGVPIEMEMSLFLRTCPAPTIGITGTKGKTSTATLCAEMMRVWDPRTVLAGNMGVSALAQLAHITPDTPVMLELSSWQLEALDEHGLAPTIAVLTNISEDHLNHYDGFADYAATKRSIARHLRPQDVLIVNADDPEAWRASSVTAARVIPFGVSDRGEDGAWLAEGGALRWRAGAENEVLPRPETLPLAGTHGALNALAAMAAARTRGASLGAIAAGLVAFRGVPDRQEVVAEIGDVTFVNDTTATAPAAAIAGLEMLAERGVGVHLICGGADKRTDLRGLAVTAARLARAIYLLDGTATPALAAMLVEQARDYAGPFGSMDAAVEAAAAAAEPGEAVLLSPGCASFGLFRDEFERGEHFRAAVRRLATGDAAGLVASAVEDGVRS